MTVTPFAIDLPSRQCFPLVFREQALGRELVLLGVVPVGAINAHSFGGGCWWHLDLPLMHSKMRSASSIERARGDIEHALIEWLDAASAAERRRGASRYHRTRLRHSTIA